MLLFIDNYDSFTYNIVQYLQELQQDVSVHKNDEITIVDIEAMKPNAIILGPGPKTPDEAGICLDVIDYFAGRLPIFGICLGHQAIGQAFGAVVTHAKHIMHGRISNIFHNYEGVFTNVPSPFNATRYHSLVIEENTLPECLQVTAWTLANKTETNENLEHIHAPQHETKNSVTVEQIMAIRHKEFAIQGVQFHPESILTEYGYHILNNFLIEHKLAKINNNTLPMLG